MTYSVLYSVITDLPDNIPEENLLPMFIEQVGGIGNVLKKLVFIKDEIPDAIEIKDDTGGSVQKTDS